MLEPEEIPEMEIYSSTNPEDANNVLTPEGWKPKPSDDNPYVLLDFPEEYPLVEVTFDTENTEEVELVVLNDNDDELDRQTPEVRKQ